MAPINVNKATEILNVKIEKQDKAIRLMKNDMSKEQVVITIDSDDE